MQKCKVRWIVEVPDDEEQKPVESQISEIKGKFSLKKHFLIKLFCKYSLTS